MASETILAVDDEQNIRDLARMYLERDGYQVVVARDGAEALRQIQALRPALVVLDLMLPEVDGWEVCRRVRAASDLPILMLTARDDDVDKIVGLELGADDYMTKPFNPRELVARVRAILRRTTRSAEQSRPVHVGDVVSDPARREVTVRGKPVNLRTKEFDLLLTLAEHRGIVLSREKLLELAWGWQSFRRSLPLTAVVSLRRAWSAWAANSSWPCRCGAGKESPGDGSNDSAAGIARCSACDVLEKAPQRIGRLSVLKSAVEPTQGKENHQAQQPVRIHAADAGAGRGNQLAHTAV